MLLHEASLRESNYEGMGWTVWLRLQLGGWDGLGSGCGFGFGFGFGSSVTVVVVTGRDVADTPSYQPPCMFRYVWSVPGFETYFEYVSMCGCP